MTQREEKLIDAVTHHISIIRYAAMSLRARPDIPIDANILAVAYEREVRLLREGLSGYSSEISCEVLGGDLDMEDGSEGRDEEEMREEKTNYEHEPR